MNYIVVLSIFIGSIQAQNVPGNQAFGFLQSLMGTAEQTFNFAGSAANSVAKGVAQNMGGLTNGASQAVNSLGNTATDTLKNAGQFIDRLTNGIGLNSNMGSSAGEAVSGVIGVLTNGTGQVVSRLGNTASGGLGSAGQAVSAISGSAGQVLNSAGNSVNIA